MKRILACLCCSLLLTACGVKHPLMRPSEIPAYEAKQQRRIQELQQQEQTGSDEATPPTLQPVAP